MNLSALLALLTGIIGYAICRLIVHFSSTFIQFILHCSLLLNFAFRYDDSFAGLSYVYGI